MQVSYNDVPKINAPRGTQDLLPPESELVAEVETYARDLFDRFGYRRIDLPVFEHTEAFSKAAGESSDMVRKEMYDFEDKSGRLLTLRPEGTPGVVRAYVEHRLDASMPVPVRLYYLGPMFRYERPQSGRQRQFAQLGPEAIGSGSPVLDAEILIWGRQFFEGLKLDPVLLLSSLGCPQDRERYRPLLRQALSAKLDLLCHDCHERLKSNPLRVFDCKVVGCAAIVRSPEIPNLFDNICESCREHHESVLGLLRVSGLTWTHDPYLVRGLDYYTKTVFEFTLPELGARSTIGAGGRYDGLVELFGGKPTPAVGMAVGVEPVMVALFKRREPPHWSPDAYVIFLDESLAANAMTLSLQLRRAGARTVMSDGPSSMRSSLRAADRIGARFAVILGPDEAARDVVGLRDLIAKTQADVALKDVVASIRTGGSIGT